MSWKGFQKGVTRAPQTFKQRFNVGDITKDAIYQDAERRFQEMEKETNKLHDESKKYFDAINAMLTHQIEFSKAIAEIYKPISGRASDPDSFISEGNPEGIRACEEYEQIVHELQETLAPELEMIDSRVVKPAMELLETVKVMRKTATKRDHKQIDYDRHRATLKKLQEKKEKTLKDEKALYKAENDVEQATQEYAYFNDLMKEELPKLFALEREFIQPLFQSFYYMQLNVFYTLHEKMQSIDIGYFNLTLDIEEAFEAKRGDAQQQAETLAITHFRTTGGKTRPSQSRYGNRPALEGAHRPLAIEGAKQSPSSSRPSLSSESAPPPYSTDSNGQAGSPAPTAGWGGVASQKAKPPPPTKPKPGRLGGVASVETVTALYDYEAQAAGDLSFSQGDVIEIVSRTANENEWWTGKVAGREGQFPGNYVQLHG
ncbi:MAG: hypothetical protein M1828_004829 [Chrysothrix sp. TS-e1954]|nr:MAG: hypothetical protein M1828_004829 [Chrysothrix sp. TS-e1954]